MWLKRAVKFLVAILLWNEILSQNWKDESVCIFLPILSHFNESASLKQALKLLC